MKKTLAICLAALMASTSLAKAADVALHGLGNVLAKDNGDGTYTLYVLPQNNNAGQVSIDQTTQGTTNGVVSLPASVSGAGTAPSSSSALAANQVVKSASGNLYGFQISADPTLAAAPWWVMIHDATSAPADGPVTPKKCYAMPSGTLSYSAAWEMPVYFATGIVIGVSTTGCFAKTASTHAFISGDAK